MRLQPGFLVACALIASTGCKSHPPRDRVESPPTSGATVDQPESGYSDLTEEPSISLRAAIALAQVRSPNATFLHAEVGEEDGRANTLLCFWAQERCLCIEIDAETGEVIFEGSPGMVEEQTAAKMLRIADSKNHPIAPELAIARAISAVPGSWARMLTLDDESGALEYSVEVVAGEVVKEVRLLAVNAELVSIQDAQDQFEVIDEVD
jgi:uncharacterized membrane protein YkoI